MATFYKQACPLCATEAEYCLVDYGLRKYFKCQKCSYFQISVRAEKVLAESSQGRRDFYANEAPKGPEEHLLFIRIPDHEQRQQSSDPLQATFVAKSELPLTCA